MSEIDSGNDVSGQADGRRRVAEARPHATAAEGAPIQAAQLGADRCRGTWCSRLLASSVFKAVGPEVPPRRRTSPSRRPRGTLTVAVSANGSVVSANSSAVDPGVSGTVAELGVSLGTQGQEGRRALRHRELRPGRERGTGARPRTRTRSRRRPRPSRAKTQAEREQEHERHAGQEPLPAGEVVSREGRSQRDPGASRPEHRDRRRRSDKIEIAQENYDAAVCSTQSATHGPRRPPRRTTTRRLQDRPAGLRRGAQVVHRGGHGRSESAYLGYQNANENANKRTVHGADRRLRDDAHHQQRRPARVPSSTLADSGSPGGRRTASTSSSGSTPIVISDLSALEAQVQIAETDRPKVKQGQTVELTFNAVPDLTITGKVAEIDAVGTSSSGVVTYGVTVDVRRAGPAAQSGDDHGGFDRDQRRSADVLLVPNAAVKTRHLGQHVRAGARHARRHAARRDGDRRRVERLADGDHERPDGQRERSSPRP